MLEDFFSSILYQIPDFIYAIILLIIACFAAKFVKSLVHKLLKAVNAEKVKARLMSLSGILSCLPLALLLLVGGTLVVKGSLSLGMLYVFINLSGNVSGVMMNLPSHLAAFRRFQGNLERVWKETGCDRHRNA